MNLDLSEVAVPSLAQIDMFLAMHSRGEPEGDIRIIKEAKIRDGVVEEMPVIEGFGSSEIEDTDGDTFHKTALESLCKARPGLNTWSNHEFKLPDNLVGSLIEAPEFRYGSKDWPTGAIAPKGDNWAGVWIRSDIELDNPPAALLHKFVKKGRRLGWSVGCMYTKYRKKSDSRGATKGFEVYEVKPVEWSVVGVPANQASWIETTRKHLVAKGHTEFANKLDGGNAPLLYKFSHWDELPETEAVIVRRVMERLESQFGLTLGVPFEGGAPKRLLY